jgi:hypothetical protein
MCGDEVRSTVTMLPRVIVRAPLPRSRDSNCIHEHTRRRQRRVVIAPSFLKEEIELLFGLTLPEQE